MPVKIHEVKSYDEHQNLMNSLHDKIVYCWYVGAKLSSTGESWCGDCRSTEPVIREYLKNLKVKDGLEVHVIYTEIEKDYFKGDECDFRIDPKIKLQKVPTLLYLKNMKILVEDECKDTAQLDIFFENVKL